MSPGQPRLWQTCPESCCSFSRVRRAMWECWLWMWLLQCRQCRHSMISIHFYTFLCYWFHCAFFISFHTHNAAYDVAHVGNVSAWMSVLNCSQRILSLSSYSLRVRICQILSTHRGQRFTLVHLLALGALGALGRWSWCRVPDQSKATGCHRKYRKESVLP